jgi:hypothetical protein
VLEDPVAQDQRMDQGRGGVQRDQPGQQPGAPFVDLVQN